MVATRINGVPELIEGRTIRSPASLDRADLLAAALRDMLANGSRRAALAAAGRERVATDFEADACVGDLRSLLRRYGVIDGSGEAHGPAVTR